MIWLSLLLIIFWKPIFWLGKHAYTELYKKQDSEEFVHIKAWFATFWGLLTPRGI